MKKEKLNNDVQTSVDWDGKYSKIYTGSYTNTVNIFKTTLDWMISDDYKVLIRANKTPSEEHKTSI